VRVNNREGLHGPDFDFAKIAVNGAPLQRKLAVGDANDPSEAEAEADRVAERVIRMQDVAPPVSANAGGILRRKCATCENENESKVQRKATGGSDMAEAPPIVHDVLSSSAQPLDAATRAFMEPRFGHDFSKVRIHADDNAARSAKAVNARAYTVGRDVVFGQGHYAPHTATGRNLLAHELTHAIQQGAGAGPVRRRWDAVTTECASEPQDRSIASVVVDQQRPQHITLNWSNGAHDTFPSSAGKGHCCNEDTTSRPACDVAGSRVTGSNCTPITTGTGYPVQNRVLDHSGIRFWTEFVPERGVALHEYAPVDGTALSHGCVRLNTDAAIKMFCGARQFQTRVQVINPARPDCANENLKNAWLGDFSTAAEPLDGEKKHDDNVLETRRELASAFGRTRPPAEYSTLTAANIPRCVQRTVEEDRLTHPNAPGGVTGASMMSGTPEAGIASQFTTAYTAAANQAAADSVTRQKGSALWQTARTGVQGSSTIKNDRPLYWARLQMASTIRTANAAWKQALAPSARQAAQESQLQILERASRGFEDVSFGSVPGQKKILVTGFDPFQLDSQMRRSNPSGAAALDLDGQTLTAGTGATARTARVESAIFPVRFADFDAGRVEQLIGPLVNGPNPVDMVVTISQGGTDFELEQYAGRRRSGGNDNLGQSFGTQNNPVVPTYPGSSSPSSEFLETTTSAGMRSAMAGPSSNVAAGGQTFGVTTDPHVRSLSSSGTVADKSGAAAIAASDRSVEGSGGGYLSNEIYYRAVAIVRGSAHASIPMIHLHTPALDYTQATADFETRRTAIVQAVRQILTRALPQLP
jgi:hypothetical protein